jgi:hypothetical protein
MASGIKANAITAADKFFRNGRYEEKLLNGGYGKEKLLSLIPF